MTRKIPYLPVMTFVEAFNPLSDITAWELAQGMKMLRAYFLQSSINKDDFDALPTGVKRHFTIQTFEEEAEDDSGL